MVLTVLVVSGVLAPGTQAVGLPRLLHPRDPGLGPRPTLPSPGGRRGGYRDPESQASIESWFSKLKERLVWRSECETLEETPVAIAAYVETYHHRPHSGLGYRTPKEVRETWEDAKESETSTKSRGLG